MAESAAVREKAILRGSMREKLDSLASDAVVSGKMGVFQQLRQLSLLDAETNLLGYHPHQNELNCLYFLRVWISEGRSLCLPRVAVDGITLEAMRVPDILAVRPGFRGIMEPDEERCAPVPMEEIDAVLVPGLAFDQQGRRLGRGGGHYDRLLARLPGDCVTIGLAYDWQVVDSVPAEAWDQPVDWLATPTALTRCRA